MFPRLYKLLKGHGGVRTRQPPPPRPQMVPMQRCFAFEAHSVPIVTYYQEPSPPPAASTAHTSPAPRRRDQRALEAFRGPRRSRPPPPGRAGYSPGGSRGTLEILLVISAVSTAKSCSYPSKSEDMSARARPAGARVLALSRTREGRLASAQGPCEEVSTALREPGTTPSPAASWLLYAILVLRKLRCLRFFFSTQSSN